MRAETVIHLFITRAATGSWLELPKHPPTFPPFALFLLHYSNNPSPFPSFRLALYCIMRRRRFLLRGNAHSSPLILAMMDEAEAEALATEREAELA